MKQKHGIDFEKAQLLWADPDRIQIPAKTVDEPRFMVIGKIEGKLVGNTHLSGRVISELYLCGRSRKEEIEIYEG
jgi:uncharacterized DUF497 family protein